METKYLYIIGKYIRRDFPKNALPLFIYLRPDNVLIIKLELKPNIELEGLKERLLDIISTLFFGFKEHFCDMSTGKDILTNYQDYLIED